MTPPVTSHTSQKIATATKFINLLLIEITFRYKRLTRVCNEINILFPQRDTVKFNCGAVNFVGLCEDQMLLDWLKNTDFGGWVGVNSTVQLCLQTFPGVDPRLRHAYLRRIWNKNKVTSLATFPQDPYKARAVERLPLLVGLSRWRRCTGRPPRPVAGHYWARGGIQSGLAAPTVTNLPGIRRVASKNDWIDRHWFLLFWTTERWVKGCRLLCIRKKPEPPFLLSKRRRCSGRFVCWAALEQINVFIMKPDFINKMFANSGAVFVLKFTHL